MSSMDLQKIEESKIECARKFSAKITSDQVKYEVVNKYGKVMELVKQPLNLNPATVAVARVLSYFSCCHFGAGRGMVRVCLSMEKPRRTRLR